jgi:hypothetical protein
MTRKAHVKRLYNGDDPTSDIWIDVMRIDSIDYFNNHWTPQSQGVIYTYKWLDDQGEDQNPIRKTHQIAVYDPANPPSDKPQPGDDETVTLTIVDQIQQTKHGDSGGMQSFRVFKQYQNHPDSERPTKRKYTVLQVFSNDFGGGDSDPFAGQAVNFTMDWDSYSPLLQAGATDDSQYIYEEVIDEFEVKDYANQNFQGANADGQDIFFIMANLKWVDYLFTVLGQNWADLGIFSPNTAPPVLPDPNAIAIRTDPFQTIVNVQWGGLAVEFYPKDT